MKNKTTLSDDLSKVITMLHSINLTRLENNSISLKMSDRLLAIGNQLSSAAIESLDDEWTDEVERICGKKPEEK
jgi:hypothetical protein